MISNDTFDQVESSRSQRLTQNAILTIAVVSCSMLMYEILLTRICALRLFFHFGYLVVSNCLLGIGASGTLIYVLRHTWEHRKDAWLWTFAVGYVAALVAVYPFLLSYEVGPNFSLSSMSSIWRLSVFNLVAAIPFFFAGGVIGSILSFNSENVNRVYFFDLLGAGFGCLMCPLFLRLTGAGGSFVVLTLLAVMGAVAAAPPRYRKFSLRTGIALGLVGLSLLPFLDQWFPVPGTKLIEFSPVDQVVLSGAKPLSRWSATSRVDLWPVDHDKRKIFQLGPKATDVALPDEQLIMQDGWAGTYILNFGEHPEMLDVVARTTYGTAMKLKKDARVFIIGVGGGNDVWAAKLNGASYTKGIELNKQILDIHREVLPHFSKGIIDDPQIDLVFGEGRSALMRETQQYDIIQMSGIDTWTSLTSGAYMLAENYLYTVEALETMYDRLAPNGIMQITRMAEEMETLRMLANIHEAFKNRGAEDLANSIVCLSTPPLMAILAKKGEFTPQELDILWDFAEAEGIPIVSTPGRDVDTAVQAFVRSEDKERYIREYPRNISPTYDDSPYFFNFTVWSNLFGAARHIEEPPHISQGNPAFIFGQLALSGFLGLLLVLSPIAVFMRKGMKPVHVGRFFFYFGGVGLGFIGIEIVLMQKLVLFLGHPLYSLVVTLFSLLIFTGVGSLFSERWFRSPTPKVWAIPLALGGLVGAFIVFSPSFVSALIWLPTLVRMGLAIVVLAPVGLLLGVPFAYGIRLLNHHNPDIIPWAWAVNACATVMGSILTVIVSMNFGFNFVLIAAVITYLVSFCAVHTLSRSSA